MLKINKILPFDHSFDLHERTSLMTCEGVIDVNEAVK